MRALSATKLLDAWERGFARSPAQRGLLLLSLACEEISPGEVAALTAGERDARLLALREQTFGSLFASVTSCPACHAKLEFHVEADELRVASAKKKCATVELKEAGYVVEFRLPTSADLAELDPATDLETNRKRLLRRCLSQARRAGKKIPATRLPKKLEAAVIRRMEEADPQADVQLAFACPQCRGTWQTSFDIISYFWKEISAWAGRLLREVNWLASAYGWTEAEVLGLTAWRRQAYLELIEP